MEERAEKNVWKGSTEELSYGYNIEVSQQQEQWLPV